MNDLPSLCFKQLPNLLTLVRVLLSCFLVYYLLNHSSSATITIPLIISLVIFLTDFFDGKIARASENSSSFGAVFDILADLFYIVSFYSVLYFWGLLPLWFLLIILLKFLEFIITSFFLSRQSLRKSPIVFDILGRIVAVLFYIIPLICYLSFKGSLLFYNFMIHILFYIVACLAFISSLYRLWNCIKLSHSLS